MIPQHLIKLVSLMNEEMDESTKEHQSEIEVIGNEIFDTNQRLERIYDAIETDNVDLRYLTPRIRQEKLMARKAEVQAHLSDRSVIIASPDVVARDVEDLHALLAESSLAERRTFIKGFVQEVRVKGEEVTLTYTIPMSHSGNKSEKVGVLPTVLYGGR